jgi:hypothetical protein
VAAEKKVRQSNGSRSKASKSSRKAKFKTGIESAGLFFVHRVKCPACQDEMVQKNRPLLAVVGIALLFSPTLALITAYFWLPGIILFLTGIYLLIWATRGKGLWCRNCKKFSLF